MSETGKFFIGDSKTTQQLVTKFDMNLAGEKNEFSTEYRWKTFAAPLTSI